MQKISRDRIIVVLFFFSGVSGLIYEVVWARLLGLVFGSTVYAVSTILVAYMAGLSIGSFFGGRISERLKYPVFYYGIFELCIGLFAIAVPFMFNAVNSLHVSLFHILSPSRFSFTMIRFFMLSILLVIPTAMMGATLPLLGKGLIKNREEIGNRAGTLYALNTLGAVCGVLFAAFIGIEKLGLRYTSLTAAFLNIIIAFAVFLLFRVKKAALTIDRERDVYTKGSPLSPIAKCTLAAYAVSGFCALSLEILWTRELVFFLGSGTYAFGTMLSVFLTGIVLGSSILSLLIKRIKRPFLMLGIFELCIGATTLLNFIFIPRLYHVKQELFLNLGHSIFSYVLSGYAVTVVLMIIPTFFMGAAFPLATQLYSEDEKKIGHSIGKIYSFNTVGSIAGSLATGFILIPLLGINNTFKIIIIINIAIGITILMFTLQKRNRLHYILLLSIPLAAALLFNLPFKKPLVVFSYIMDDPDNTLLHYSEDAYASVSVIDIPGVGRRLYVDSGLAADTSRFDMPSHKMIVHIPLLLMDNPQNALVIGFGMGETSHSITTHGVHVDAVEISQGAIDANHYFRDVNHDILNNELFTLTIDDGRNYLLTHDEKYDLISVGIIHPGISANSAGFYGIDFYTQCKEKLSDSGMISQWVPTHGLSLEAFKVIIKTFTEVFPHSSLWFKFTDNFVILLGSEDPLRIDFDDFILQINSEEVLTDLRTVDMTDPFVMLDSFWMDTDALEAFSTDAAITSDDHPILEFMSVRSIHDIGIDNLEALQRKHERVETLLYNVQDWDQVTSTLETVYEATNHLVQGQLYYKKQRYDQSIAELEQAVALYPGDQNTVYLLNYVRETYLNKLLVMAEENFGEDRITDALRLYFKALELKPDHAEVYNYIGMCFSALGDYDSAINAVKTALFYDSENFQFHFNLASLLASIGHYDESKMELEISIRLNPGFSRARDALQQLTDYLDRQ